MTCAFTLPSPATPFSDPAALGTLIKVNYSSEVMSSSQAYEKPGFAVLRGGAGDHPGLRLLSYPSGRGSCFVRARSTSIDLA